MTVSFDFKGGREIERALAELGEPRDLRRIATAATREAAEIVAQEARQLVPVDTGTLQSAIKTGNRVGTRARRFRGARGRAFREAIDSTVEQYVGIDESVRPARPAKNPKRKRSAGGSSGGAVGFYAQVVEFGLPNQKAQPFMRPAFEAKAQEANDAMGDILWRRIEKRARFLARRAGRL